MSSESPLQNTPQERQSREPATIPVGKSAAVIFNYGCPNHPPDCSYDCTEAVAWLEAALGAGVARAAADAEVGTACHLKIHIHANVDLPAFTINVTGGAGMSVPVHQVSVRALSAGEDWVSSAVEFFFLAGFVDGTIHVSLGPKLHDKVLNLHAWLTTS